MNIVTMTLPCGVSVKVESELPIFGQTYLAKIAVEIEMAFLGMRLGIPPAPTHAPARAADGTGQLVHAGPGSELRRAPKVGGGA